MSSELRGTGEPMTRLSEEELREIRRKRHSRWCVTVDGQPHERQNPCDCGKATADKLLAHLDAITEAVEGLAEQAGGRCVKPDDYAAGEMNVCETHSELMWDDGCEDQPRQALAALAILRGTE